WRALARADALMPELRAPAVNLWFGTRTHLVHYPVRGGSLINVVAIVRDDWREPGWSATGERAEILARYRATMWAAVPRALPAPPEQWQKWALYDRPPLVRWGKGAVTLLGDAAHPMLPCLAQGAAMAIEDAAVLAQRLADARDDPAGAMRRYERQRRGRPARAPRPAPPNGVGHPVGGTGAVSAHARAHRHRRRAAARALRLALWLEAGLRLRSPPACPSLRPPSPEACQSPPGSPSPIDCGRPGGPPVRHSPTPSATRRCSRSSCRRIAASTSSPTASSRASISCTAFSNSSTGSISRARSRSASAPTATRRWCRPSRVRFASRRACMRARRSSRAPTPSASSSSRCRDR